MFSMSNSTQIPPLTRRQIHSCYARTLSLKAKPLTRGLFVDDDVATREGYVDHLTQSGYDVTAAATGREALAFANAWAPNVIVLDLGFTGHRRMGGGAATESPSRHNCDTDHRLNGC